MPIQPPNHPPERTDRDALLRDLILEAALEVLDRDGLGLNPDTVTYAKVFGHLADEYGVSIGRGSVHGRIWDRQDDYRLEVLDAAAKLSLPRNDSRAMGHLAASLLERLHHHEPRDRVRAFCRIAAPALLSAYLESESFRRVKAIKAVARAELTDDRTTGSAAADVLRATIQRAADEHHAEWTRQFDFVFDALHLRPRAALQLERGQAVGLFVTVVQILITGSHLDHHAGFVAMASKVDTDLATDEEWPWTYVAFALLACMDFLFEADPAPEPAPLPPPLTNPADAAGVVEPPDVAALIGRRPRRSRDELRRLVVAAGVELFLRDGIGLRADSLTYARVFDHIKRTRGITLHRSTVHGHVWTDQDHFRSDVLAEAARYGTEESLATMEQAMAAQTVTRNPDGSVNVRQLILDNSLATVSAQMMVAATSPTFKRWQTIKAATLSPMPNDRVDGIRQAVNTHYEEMIEVFIATYRSVLPLVGLGVNPDLALSEDQAYHLFAVVCAALSSGSDFNISAGVDLAARTVTLPRADGPGCDDWPVPAVASLALLDLLFVPRDPEPTEPEPMD